MKVRLSGRTSVKVSVVVRVKVSVTVRVNVSVGDERVCVYRCHSLIRTGRIGRCSAVDSTPSPAHRRNIVE